MTQLLANDFHYNRLVDVLPNLHKLRLVPMSRIPYHNHFSDKYWTPLSLPAKYICHGPESALEIRYADGRLDYHTVITHGRSGVRYERPISSAVDQIIISKPFEAPPPGQACPHNDISDYIRDFRLHINNALEPILPFLGTDRVKFIFRLYGWSESCECGSTREGFAKIANALKFNWPFDNELPLDIKFEFFPLEDKQVCEVCGE
jgi:hypothetical protein